MSETETKTKTKISWRDVHRAEAVDFVRKFYRTSYDWRSQAWHDKWDKWERNYRNIYDPAIKAKKETWQACMFVPVTPTNVEVITSALTKLASGKKRPIGYEPRELGDELQAELNTDILDFYREKGSYELARYDAAKEGAIFGSGFMKVWWEKRYGKRKRVSDIYESLSSAIRNFRKPQKRGQKTEWEEVLVKNGIRFQHVHIRNLFPEPNTLEWDRYIHREKLTYNEISRMAEMGFFDKDSVKELWTVRETDNFEVDTQPVKYEQDITDPTLPRPTYDKKHTVWEFNGMIPMKWINLDMEEDSEEGKKKAEEVAPGKILVASGHYYLTSGEGDGYDETPNLVKLDYIRSGQTYAIGVAQLIEGLQEEMNEIRNQRIDNVSMAMNRIIAVIEKYVVEPKELVSRPGAVWRFKGTEIDNIKNIFAEVNISDVPISSYRETQELERQIQETSAANRVTTGTAGLQKDTNQTLGGMELLKQAAFDRFMVYAYIIGKQFDTRVARKCAELIYLNIDDESVRNILGMEPIEKLPGQFVPRWQCWERKSPEEMDICFDLVPVDVFAMENRLQKSQDLVSKAQLTASLIPGWDPKPILERIWKLSDFTSDEIAEVLKSLSGNAIPTPMGMGQGVPSIARPTKQTVGEASPLPKVGGQNGMMNGAGR